MEQSTDSRNSLRRRRKRRCPLFYLNSAGPVQVGGEQGMHQVAALLGVGGVEGLPFGRNHQDPPARGVEVQRQDGRGAPSRRLPARMLARRPIDSHRPSTPGAGLVWAAAENKAALPRKARAQSRAQRIGLRRCVERTIGKNSCIATKKARQITAALLKQTNKQTNRRITPGCSTWPSPPKTRGSE